MRQFKKDIKDITVSGIGLGVGASVMGANANVLSPVGRGLGMASNLSAFGMMTRQVKKLNRGMKK